MEALARRALKGRPFPSMNNVVDACNLAVLKTFIAMSVFDADKISGDGIIRFARESETFAEIGGKGPTALRGGEMVVSDREKIFSIPDESLKSLHCRTTGLALSDSLTACLAFTTFYGLRERRGGAQ